MSRTKYVHFLVCKRLNQISTLDSLHNSRLHFYFKIYSLKDISNFLYSNQKMITFLTERINRSVSPIYFCLKFIFNAVIIIKTKVNFSQT